MKISLLIARLEQVQSLYGDLEVQMCTETEKTGQVQQAVADLAVPSNKSGAIEIANAIVVLLPEGF